MKALRIMAIAVAALLAMPAAPSPAWAERGYNRFTGRPGANPGFREGKYGSRYNYRTPRFQRLPAHTRYPPGPRRPSVASGSPR